MAENIIRRRAARLVREDAQKHLMGAASDMDRMGLVNMADSLAALRKALIAYDAVMIEADALYKEACNAK